MDHFLTISRDLSTVISGLVVVFIGGIGAFFVIKYQVTKDLQNTISIYKEEIAAMQLKLTSLQDQITTNLSQITLLTTERDGIRLKKDYLKSIIIQALSNKASVDETLTKELQEKLRSK